MPLEDAVRIFVPLQCDILLETANPLIVWERLRQLRSSPDFRPCERPVRPQGSLDLVSKFVIGEHGLSRTIPIWTLALRTNRRFVSYPFGNPLVAAAVAPEAHQCDRDSRHTKPPSLVAGPRLFLMRLTFISNIIKYNTM